MTPGNYTSPADTNAEHTFFALDTDVLEFVRTHRLDASVDDEIRRAFGSPARFYQRLTRLLADPAAVALEPQLVYRLQHIRDARSRARAQRHLI